MLTTWVKPNVTLSRGYEHLGLSVLTNNKLKYNKNSATAVRTHIHDCDHASSLHDFKIIGSASNDFHLKIKESLLIHFLTNSNRSYLIAPIYSHILLIVLGIIVFNCSIYNLFA